MSRAGEHELIAKTRNTARYFSETRHVAWVLLVATLLFGVFAYVKMPKRKDPFIKIRIAVAVCAWPGASAEKVEELVTRRIEEKIAQNAEVEKIEATSRTSVSIVTVTLRESLPVDQIAKTFDDIDLKLRSIRDLPQGALPIEFQKDFGDTSALMLTIASPRAREVEISLRAKALAEDLARSRRGAAPGRSAIVLGFPASLNPTPMRRVVQGFAAYARASGLADDVRLLEGTGYFALDGRVRGSWEDLKDSFLRDRQAALFHPEIWRSFVVGEPSEIEAALRRASGDAYSYRELDDFTDRIGRELRGLPSVAKVTRAGVLGERIYLDYSQERFAAVGITQQSLREAIAARNIQTPGGVAFANGRAVAIEPSGEYRTETEVGDTLLTTTAAGAPVHVHDVVDVTRDYEAPPSFTNSLTWKSGDELVRTRAITIAIQMRHGEHIGRFSAEVDEALSAMRQTLPEDLVIARTSDQAQQVEEKIGLFMTSLYEAIAIIVVVGFVGFREWRSALVLALSIPLTLAMTFVFMYALGIDIQQMSIAALILALGLLVDDPVVAGDAIKQELDDGKPRLVAAWLGPTKLGRAIVFATITNIVAYLPFLLIPGSVGNFIYSLPIVLTCSLVASRLVSMTFIPLLGYTLLRRRVAKTAPVSTAFGGGVDVMGHYRRAVAWCIRRRYKVLALSLVVLAVGGLCGRRLRSSFFPQDYSHLFTVDVFLPEDASIRSTADAAAEADRIVREVAVSFGASQRRRGPDKDVVRSIATFVGGGAPRFWYSLSPQQRQPNYAQLVIDVIDEHDTAKLIAPLQDALTSRVPGARFDVRQLENGKPVPMPVEIRFSGDDPAVLHALAERAKALLHGIDVADRVRDDWGENSFRVTIDVDPARAALAGVSNQDVANASAAGFSGVPLNVLRDGEKLVPIVARLRYEERGSAGDVEDLYVLAARGAKVPLGSVARVSYRYAAEKIQRRNQRRTISVSCFPIAGKLPSEVMNAARADLASIERDLSPGYRMEIGGTEENVVKVRKESAVVAVVSIVAILLTLVIQFRHALKPLIVLAAIPYGGAGAVIAITVMGSPFGFTAILGVISLIGVIVSHIIVLFDYIEEAHERGEDLEKALVDAGTARMRPVIITVGATVLGLVPLALHGGPLWEPLCYAQLGGLTLATVITLVLVPVLYTVFVVDLRWIRWDTFSQSGGTAVMPRPPVVLVPSPSALGERAHPESATLVIPARRRDGEAR